jgi:hypothetical protein
MSKLKCFGITDVRSLSFEFCLHGMVHVDGEVADEKITW